MDITPYNTQTLFNSNYIPDNTFIHIKPRNNGRMLSGIVRDCRIYPHEILVLVSDLHYVTPEQIISPTDFHVDADGNVGIKNTDSPPPSAPKLKQILKIIHNHEPDLVDEIRKGVDHRPTEREQHFNWPKDRLILPLSDPRARRLMVAPVLVPQE